MVERPKGDRIVAGPSVGTIKSWGVSSASMVPAILGGEKYQQVHFNGLAGVKAYGKKSIWVIPIFFSGGSRP
jgi:hypothetical protein